MSERKTIAVVIGHITNEYHGVQLDGIISQAKHLGYNVAVFSPFYIRDELTPHQFGEENILNLMNFDKLAGVLYFDSSIWAWEEKKRVFDFLKKNAGGKVVCINANDPHGFYNVVLQENQDFAILVDHMIEVHGLKKIYCLAGPEKDRVSQIRLEGYVESMKRHGLEVRDDYIFYGDFWENAAKVLANDIADGKVEMPEAIVCENDCMAINLCNTFIERKIRVPEDIVVTGFDSSIDAFENVPSITTYQRSQRAVGAESVCALHKLITGEDAEQIFKTDGELITGESCGCGKSMDLVKEYGYRIRERKKQTELFNSCIMIEELTASKNINECLGNILRSIYLLNGTKQFALCLNENWNRFSENDDEYIIEGYAENMSERAYFDWNDSWVSDKKFKSADMFPPEMLDENEPVCCYFTPLHFSDRCFGYAVIKYLTNSLTNGVVYDLWIKNVNTALEFMRVKERMEIINDRIYISSLRDALTGIYNRLGYKKYAAEVFETAKSEHKQMLLIVADMDGLKHINDSYGHSEGDEAITVIAQALQSCSGNSEKCARTGGDEFAVVGCYDYHDKSPDYYRQRIHGYLSRYNESSKKEYEVDVSIGCFCDYVDGYESVDKCYEIADKLMYSDKVERKKNRIN